MMYCPENEANSLDAIGVKVLLGNTDSFELPWRGISFLKEKENVVCRDYAKLFLNVCRSVCPPLA